MSTSNPWVPPSTPVADIAPPEAVVRKPISIWLMQLVCVLALLAFVVSISTSVKLWRGSSPGEIARAAYTLAIGLQCLYFALLVTAIIAMQRRSRVGQWLGALLIGGLVIIITFNGPLMAPDAQTAFTPTGRYTAITLFLAIPGLLIWFATFSKSARDWYARS